MSPTPRPVEKHDHLVLVDGSSYIFRAYHALPPLTRKSDGLPVGAVSGFCNMLWRLMREKIDGEAPTHLAVVFDASASTFRSELYEQYKAQRPEPPDDLKPQFKLIREAVRAFDLPCIEQNGFEADDLIATYACQASARGATVTIVASDKDLMQLVRPGVVMFDSMKDRLIDEAGVAERFGVPPDRVVDVQALTGDPIDNVPGVPGIGPKAAATLVAEIGPIEEILGLGDAASLDAALNRKLAAVEAELAELAGGPVKFNSAAQVADVLAQKFGLADLAMDKKGKPTIDTAGIEKLACAGNRLCELVVRARSLCRVIGGAAQKIFEHAEQARISKQLVKLECDVPLSHPIEDLGLHEPDPRRLVSFLKAMEFFALLRRVAAAYEVEPNAIDADARVGAGGEAIRWKHPGGNDAVPFFEEGGAPAGAADRSAGTAEAARAKPPEAQATPATLVAARAAEAGKPFDVAAYETITSPERLDAWIEDARETGFLAVEVLTTSLDCLQCDIVGIALALAPGRAAYVPLQHRGGADLFGGGLVPGQIAVRDALDALKPLMADPAVLKIGHNVKFGWGVLAKHGLAVESFDDVMLISYVLDAGLGGHGLDELSKRHLDHQPISLVDVTGTGRAKVAVDLVALDRATAYGAENADIALRLWRMLKPRLAAERRRTVYETLERPLVPVLARMEARGIAVDRGILGRLSADFAQTLARLEDEIFEIAGERFLLGSPKQMGDILFGKMGLPGAKKTPTGQWATPATLLEDLAEQGHVLPAKMLEWRQLSKLKSTYTDSLPAYMDANGRVHTSFALAATTTGRLSSSDPNIQNIPVRTEAGRKIRTAFVAERGQKIISADYSQIELRLLAHIADIPQLRQAFAEGLDIHAATASAMFGVPLGELDPDLRRSAKTINFGIIYGISAFGLAQRLGIAQSEASAFIRQYFERFPGIRDYMEETKRACRERGFVTTLFGRVCHYPQIRSKNPQERAGVERQAINAPIQGSAADIIRRAMTRIEGALDEAGLATRMLLQVHDELVFEAPEAEVEAALPVIRKVMEDAPHPAVQLKVPLAVDARAASNWEEAH